MVNVLTEAVIHAPREQVAEYAMNPDHAPEWYVYIHSAVWRTPKPLTVGSRIAFKAQFLARELAYVYEVVELIEREKLVMRTVNGPFPMETTYTFESVGENQTKMTLRNKGNPKGFSKVFTPVMGRMMGKANKKDLENLKAIVEK